MRFIPNGPDIPHSLINAHEEGRVVFFCGAGISSPAGLPLFNGVVEKIYEILNIEKTESEKELIKKEQYDSTLELIEKRLFLDKTSIRLGLHQILKPNYRKRNARRTHEALLKLARTLDGDYHIVTTNFDRIFYDIIQKRK